VHPPFDKAELDRGQRDDNRHQDHRLRRRAAEIEADDAVVPHLVNEDLGRFGRPALGHVVDDAEGVEEGVDDIDHQEKEARRRQQREDDRPEPAAGRSAIDGRGFEQCFWDRLQPGEEEQKIIADLLPGGGKDHQQQGLPAVQDIVPVDAGAAQTDSNDADARVEEEEPKHTGNRGGDRIGKQQHRLIKSAAADDFVGHHGKQQPRDRRQECHGEAEDQRDLD